MNKNTIRRTRRATQRMAASAAAITAVLITSCGASGRSILSTRAATTTTSKAPWISPPATTPGAPTTTPSTGAASDSSAPSIERQLGAVVRGLFATRDAASAGPTPDPDSPLLAVYAAGDALDELRAAILDRRDHGIARRPSAAHLSAVRVSDVTADASAASATFCQIDDDVLYMVSTGEIVSDAVITRLGTIDFEETDGAWKVVHADTTQMWEGIGDCARRLVNNGG